MVVHDKLHLTELLDSGNPYEISDALLYIAHNINDVEWAEAQFMRAADNLDENISGLALTCLGHLARINGRINKNVVVPFLEKKKNSTNLIISTRAEDALDDIKMFT